MYWVPPGQDGGGQVALGLCTIISGQADTPPDETQVESDFLCAPTWDCAYWAPTDEGGLPPGGPPPLGL